MLNTSDFSYFNVLLTSCLIEWLTNICTAQYSLNSLKSICYPQTIVTNVWILNQNATMVILDQIKTVNGPLEFYTCSIIHLSTNPFQAVWILTILHLYILLGTNTVYTWPIHLLCKALLRIWPFVDWGMDGIHIELIVDKYLISGMATSSNIMDSLWFVFSFTSICSPNNVE